MQRITEAGYTPSHHPAVPLWSSIRVTPRFTSTMLILHRDHFHFQKSSLWQTQLVWQSFRKLSISDLNCFFQCTRILKESPCVIHADSQNLLTSTGRGFAKIEPFVLVHLEKIWRRSPLLDYSTYNLAPGKSNDQVFKCQKSLDKLSILEIQWCLFL